VEAERLVRIDKDLNDGYSHRGSGKPGKSAKARYHGDGNDRVG
jgi:hypothetical protein